MSKENKIEMAVNHAIRNTQMARLREQATYGIAGPLDDKRKCSAWQEYGWPTHIDDGMLFSLYQRAGLAHGAVNKVVDTCWLTDPWVEESPDTPGKQASRSSWEQRADRALTKRSWRVFAEADRRRLATRFSAIILHVADNRGWSEPVAKSRRHRIVKTTAVWSTQLTPVYDVNISSSTYGSIEKWKYKEGRIGNTVRPDVEIHPDRIFILGDPTSTGWLTPAYNAFVNLEKIEGGSGESFLKNAARQLNINFDKDIDLKNLANMYGVSLEELQDRFNEVAEDMNTGNDSVLPTQGATVTPLVTNVPDPTHSYEVNLSTVSAALDISSRILIGNQSGERASTEDDKYFKRRCQSRRNSLSFDIEDYVHHLQRIGVIPVSDFEVEWDDLSASTKADRMEAALKMSQINSSSLSFSEPTFSVTEIREAAGYSNTDPGPDLEDIDPDLDDEDDEGGV